MKIKFFAVLAMACASFMFAGCVGTVDGGNRAGWVFLPDKMEGLYERTSDQVYDASKAVLLLKGVLVAERVIHTPFTASTNAPSSTAPVAGAVIYRSLEGKVNQNSVYVKVQEVDPAKPLTQVTVQVRTKAGGTDQGLAHEIEKEIALKLAQMRQ